MSEIVLFDYGQLDVETRIVVQQRTSEIKDLLRSALGDMIEAGRKCKEVRDALRHDKSGGFMGWVDKEGLGRQTVYSIMSMHDVFGNYPKFGQLDIGKTAAYLLAAPSTPEPARLEAIERAEAGETITHTVAKQIVAQHRTPPPSHRAEPEPARTLDAALPAIQPAQPPADPLGNDSRIIAMDKLAAEIRERRPAPPVRPLTDNEAEAVVWRGIAHHAKSGMPHHKLAWLQAAEVGDFSRLLNPGVSFGADQLTHIKAKIEAELSKQDRPVPEPAPQGEPESAEEKDRDEYYTPDYILEPARKVLGRIDVDPASCLAANEVTRALTYYDKESNGLLHPWRGNAWLNPPYSNPLPWIEKLFAEYEGGRLTAALVLTNTVNTPQWARLLWQSEGIVCLLNRRVKFWRADQYEGKGFDRDQMIFYIGKDHAKFRSVFGEFGAIR